MLWIIHGEPWPCEKSTLARGLYGNRQSPARYATCEMKALDYGVVELAALSALSALGCVIAAGHLVFVALFGAASTVAIIETMRRLREADAATRCLRSAYRFWLGGTADALGLSFQSYQIKAPPETGRRAGFLVSPGCTGEEVRGL
jgi:hypothetical protein